MTSQHMSDRKTTTENFMLMFASKCTLRPRPIWLVKYLLFGLVSCEKFCKLVVVVDKELLHNVLLDMVDVEVSGMDVSWDVDIADGDVYSEVVEIVLEDIVGVDIVSGDIVEERMTNKVVL